MNQSIVPAADTHIKTPFTRRGARAASSGDPGVNGSRLIISTTAKDGILCNTTVAATDAFAEMSSLCMRSNDFSPPIVMVGDSSSTVSPTRHASSVNDVTSSDLTCGASNQLEAEFDAAASSRCVAIVESSVVRLGLFTGLNVMSEPLEHGHQPSRVDEEMPPSLPLISSLDAWAAVESLCADAVAASSPAQKRARRDQDAADVQQFLRVGAWNDLPKPSPEQLKIAAITLGLPPAPKAPLAKVWSRGYLGKLKAVAGGGEGAASCEPLGNSWAVLDAMLAEPQHHHDSPCAARGLCSAPCSTLQLVTPPIATIEKDREFGGSSDCASLLVAPIAASADTQGGSNRRSYVEAF